MGKVGTGTVNRTVNLIRALALAESEVSIGYLAKAVGLPASTVHRLLALLAKEGMVEKSPVRGHYRAGVEFMRLGALAASKNEVLAIAAPYMRSIAKSSGEACTLHLFLPATLQIAAVAVERSGNGSSYRIRLNKPGILTWGASGKAVLPYLSDNRIRTAYVQDLGCPVTGQRLPPYRQYIGELVRAQRSGYSVTVSEKNAGIAALGTPLFKPTGEPLGTLNIALSEERFSKSAERQLSDLLISEAKKLNNAMGFAQGALSHRVPRRASAMI